MIRGSIVAMITPFHRDGSVNYEKCRELVEFYIEGQSDGIVVLGTTAETPALTESEKERIIRTCVEAAAGRVPIIAGSGSNNTLTAKEQSLAYQALGADGLLVVTPYYNKTNQAGMIRHFTEVADAVSIPVILYNVPGRTGCSLTCEAVAELSRHPNIAGIKEASGDISFVSRIARYVSEEFALYSGNDDMVVPLLAVGGCGVISVAANLIPRQMHQLVMSYLDGDIRRARQLQLRYLDFINALFLETNPIPVKAAMNQAGMEVGGYRLPLYPMEEAAQERLIQEMRRVEVA